MREAYPNVPDHIFATISRRFTQVETGDRINVEIEFAEPIDDESTIEIE